MAEITLRPVTPDDRDWMRRLIILNWGAEIVIVRGEVYHLHQLPGFVAMDGADGVGLVTYQISRDEVEIVTLNSLRQGQGIGKALIEAVKEVGRANGCSRLSLITTNDNLNALKFYQKRGFRLVAVYPGAVDRSRHLKPSIPRIGEYGIPIRDEIELEISLTE